MNVTSRQFKYLANVVTCYFCPRGDDATILSTVNTDGSVAEWSNALAMHYHVVKRRVRGSNPGGVSNFCKLLNRS